MDLTYHRTQLENYILRGSVASRMAKDPAKITKLLLNWWDAFKAW